MWCWPKMAQSHRNSSGCSHSEWISWLVDDVIGPERLDQAVSNLASVFQTWKTWFLLTVGTHRSLVQYLHVGPCVRDFRISPVLWICHVWRLDFELMKMFNREWEWSETQRMIKMNQNEENKQVMIPPWDELSNFSTWLYLTIYTWLYLSPVSGWPWHPKVGQWRAMRPWSSLDLRLVRHGTVPGTVPVLRDATGCYGYPMEHSMEKIISIWRSMEQFAADSTWFDRHRGSRPIPWWQPLWSSLTQAAVRINSLRLLFLPRFTNRNQSCELFICKDHSEYLHEIVWNFTVD